MRIDLNADVGEWTSLLATAIVESVPPIGSGAESRGEQLEPGAHAGQLGQDPALMPVITSANIACGFHAGDPASMRATVALAKRHGVAVGAHPGFPDRAGFGRRELPMSPREAEDVVLYQVGALAGIAAAEGVRLAHVKAHGALYNMAARDADLAAAIARATAAVDPSLVVFGLPGSEILRAAERAGLRTAREVFADRAYRADGSLVSRQQPGAVIHDEEQVVARAVRMVTERRVDAIGGTPVVVDADTICVHGDTPGAARLAARIRGALEAAGVDVRSVPR